MLEIITNNKFKVIIIHFIIGYLGTFSFFPKIFGAFILIVGLIIIVLSNNNKEEAILISGYLVGAEVFLRMTNGLLSYEMGKYGVMIFLLLGMFMGKLKTKLNPTYFFYILILLIGIVFTQVPDGESIRKAIIFNLSGPIVLGVSALYMNRRRISKAKFYDLLFFMLLPIFSTVAYLYFKTEDIRNIVFGGASNFETSGGFGPNQVSTIIGFGILLLSILIFLRVRITNFVFLDALLLAYFIYRGLLTFSRGGILSAVISLLIFSFFMLLYNKTSFQLFFKYVAIVGMFSLGVWLYTSNVTNGMLDNRYAGKNASGIEKKDASAGRFDIFKSQIESFYESPVFGIGVGNGKYKREASGQTKALASHNELSRTIEEHGMLGVVILIILIMTPILFSIELNNFQRAFSFTFVVLWFLTINHSAMRVALPGFIYGLSLINIDDVE